MSEQVKLNAKQRRAQKRKLIVDAKKADKDRLKRDEARRLLDTCAEAGIDPGKVLAKI